MKTILVIVAAMMTVGTASAQKMKNTEVPEAVKAAFAKKYPGAKVAWEKEGTDYEAEFDLDHVESSAVFTALGVFKELEQDIKIATLPKSIADYCTKQAADYSIDEAEKITDANGKVMYEVEMKKGKEQFDMLFDGQGNFIKRTPPSSKEEVKTK